MTTKIAFITDWHLKEKEKSFMKDKRKQLLSEFVQNVEWIDRVVFGWDMFDQVSVETTSEIAKFFFRDIVGWLVSKKIPVDMLVGNHEKRWKRHLYEMLDKSILSDMVTVQDKVNLVEYSDFNGIFVPYLYTSDFETTDKAEAEVKAFDLVSRMAKQAKEKNGLPVIVFNHNIMGGLWFENEKELDVKFYEINDVDFVLWGHIHKQVIFDKGLYVGSFMRSFTYEEESEGYYVLTITDNKQVKGEYIPIKSFEYEKVQVNGSTNHEWKPWHVYSVEFIFDTNVKDNFFVSNTLKMIENTGAYIKWFKITKSDEVKQLTRIISTSNSKEEILKAFLKRDKIDKSETQAYLDKLEECSQKIEKKKMDILEKEKKRQEKEKWTEKKTMMTEEIQEYAKNIVNEEFAF